MELTKEYLDQALSGLATKKDLEGLATKDDLVSEIRPLKAQLSTIEAKVDRISTRTNEDAVAAMKDIDKLDGRVKTLEAEVKKLKVHHAA